MTCYSIFKFYSWFSKKDRIVEITNLILSICCICNEEIITFFFESKNQVFGIKLFDKVRTIFLDSR